MAKGKLAKFADMAAYPHVFEYPHSVAELVPFEMRGKWREEFFKNDNPIVLELGCGRGEYTVGLGRMYPNKNFIGVDIKGARMWTGATDSLREGMTNVAFLRTNIEIIDRFFAEGEVDEIWITFPDPQMKKATKRLTSTWFLRRYASFLKPDGIIHLKTDSNFLYTYTDALAKVNNLPVEVNTTDLYGLTPSLSRGEGATDSAVSDGAMNEVLPPLGELEGARSIRTYYEQQWLDRGLSIKYLKFRLIPGQELQEPDIEIELDDYRSYNRSKRSGLQTSR